MNNVVSINPKMKVAELNRIAHEHGCRVRLIKISQHMEHAFAAVSSGRHEAALEHIRAASAQLDGVGVMACAA